MTTERKTTNVFPSQPVLEGAGVRLKRALGFGEEALFDPFLLLDDIHSADPADYTAGFPWHPHRGIETVTYVLHGTVEHGDSIGNRGSIRSGDVQWMSAGSGIVHQEMPKAHAQDFRGLQLWVNLPRSHKMSDPKYRGIEADEIPRVLLPGGGEVGVVAGTFAETQGPVTDIVRGPSYFDVALPAGATFHWDAPGTHTVFAYTLDGSGVLGGEEVAADLRVLLGPGETVTARAGGEGFRFLLFAGEPLREPVAWRGPIVMNTEEELETAFREYREGTFLKS